MTLVPEASSSDLKIRAWTSRTVANLLLLMTVLLITDGQEVPGKPKRDPLQEEEFCRNFTIGHPREHEFFSPQYPKLYPEHITCFKTITADVGYFVRIDFRDVFQVEPKSTAGKCEYDFLEVRDGDQGYSPLIGKYCGNEFPPMITSSGRSLWLRFKSDGNIEYRGFKVVYSFIENPLGNLPDMGKCAFEGGGFQEFVGSSNITDVRRQHSLRYDVPVDCVWTIKVEESFKLYIQFMDYDLEHPNDCHLNFIQIYDSKTDEDNLVKTFCGKAADSVSSKSNVVFIRFYAEKTGIQSKFLCFITAIRSLSAGESCDEETEYDCDDATCIHPDLVCNGLRNCKFGWDEESCSDSSGTTLMDFSSAHVIVILVILSLILLGMCGGLLWNLRRKLSADREELAASREKSLAASSRFSLNQVGTGGVPGPAVEIEAVPNVIPPVPAVSRLLKKGSDNSNGGCYVPDIGYPINARRF